MTERGNATDSGFSLIELLVTLALLLILTTMYYGFGSRSHQRTQQKACRANLQKIYIGLQIYANEHDGKFPVLQGAKTSEEVLNCLVPKYISDSPAFICPGSKDDALPPGASLVKNRISYSYIMGHRISEAREALMSDKLVDTQPKLADHTVFSTTGKPPGNNHHKYGGNFLFCDGSAEFSPSRIPFSLVFNKDIVLLNPKP
jgi:prepilin-type N-terminal cleavage/methylation domain-containing protein/prepilin-type processing-associated H-X9-DG protein